MMGALLVRDAPGVRFQLGTGFTDAERPAAAGGQPRSPSFTAT